MYQSQYQIKSPLIFTRILSILMLMGAGLCFIEMTPVYAEIKVKLSAKIEAEASKRVNRLSDELKSPFCPGKTLLNCTSYQAFALRKEMTEMILAGQSDKEILSALRESFGEILENPPQPWYTVLVPVMPFILGALIAAWMFSRWLRGSGTGELTEGDSVLDDAVVSIEHKDRLQALLREDD